MKTHPLPIFLLLCLALLSARPANAWCYVTGVSQTEDWRTAQIDFGRVNLADAHLQPPGTLLASTIVPPTNYTFGGANAESILWICDKEDLPELHFLVSNNGDSHVDGYHEIGGNDSYIYSTWFEYVGIKQSMAGVTLARKWRRVDLPTQDYTDNCKKDRWGNPLKNKICIRLKHIPPLHVELYRVATLTPNWGGFTYGDCWPMAKPTSTGKLYTCTQPNSYIQLVGPGLAHDNVDDDHAWRFNFWGADNGFGYGMRRATSFSRSNTCVARSATPQVLFPPISVNELKTGSATANFSVQLECSNEAISGSGKNETAIGLQASPAAFTTAQRLHLVNGSGGISHLLSDQYDSPGTARGVGIRLQRARDNADIYFLGKGSTGGGTAAGWNPFMRGANMTGLSPQPGYSYWTIEYNAILEPLPKTAGETITPGKVRATAHVLVKVQ